MPKLRLVLIAICLPLFIVDAQAGLKGIFGMKLKTLEGESYAMSQLVRNRMSVLVFLLPDCPACETYTLTLNNLSDKYKGTGINFYGIIPGQYNTKKEMLEFKSKYKIQFPLLHDDEKRTVNYLGATIAPSVFLLNPQGEVVYKGRIDDTFYAPGKKKTLTNSHELRDALQAIMDGKNISFPPTQAIGCIIE